MESTPPDLRTVEGDDQSTSEELLETHNAMTNQPDSVEKLWNKYCHEGDEDTPDRMFYENFVDAITEAIAGIDEAVEEAVAREKQLRDIHKIELDTISCMSLEQFVVWSDQRKQPKDDTIKALQDKK